MYHLVAVYVDCIFVCVCAHTHTHTHTCTALYFKGSRQFSSDFWKLVFFFLSFSLNAIFYIYNGVYLIDISSLETELKCDCVARGNMVFYSKLLQPDTNISYCHGEWVSISISTERISLTNFFSHSICLPHHVLHVVKLIIPFV
jgi:hypothetical protein